ncbi:ComEC/Rec2 family competence protein [Gemmobacter lanyuensis]
MPAVTLVLSSAVAGVATAPFGAAHFNRFADFGFVANLLTVPVMGAVVMPAGRLPRLPRLWIWRICRFGSWALGVNGSCSSPERWPNARARLRPSSRRGLGFCR